MKNETTQQDQKDKTDNFIRFFSNMNRCKGLDWKEKALLSNYISYQIEGDEFYQTDEYQATILGMSSGQISKLTSRLKERGEISTKIVYVENPNGGRPIPKRYVKVLDIDKWTKGNSIPKVKKVESKNKKKQKKEMVEHRTATQNNTNIRNDRELTLANNPKTPSSNDTEVELVQTIVTIEPLVQPNGKLKPVLANTSILPTKSTTSPIVGFKILNAFEDIVHDDSIGETIINQMKMGKVFDFLEVNLKFDGDDYLLSEVVKVPGSDKYYLKKYLVDIEPTLFNKTQNA